MGAMLDRETRREKILEAKNKEMRLKEKTKGILGLGGTGEIMMQSGRRNFLCVCKKGQFQKRNINATFKNII